MREMSIDAETRSTLPDRETRKWMAAQANVTVQNGEMKEHFDNQEDGPNKFRMPNSAQQNRMKKAYNEVKSTIQASQQHKL